MAVRKPGGAVQGGGVQCRVSTEETDQGPPLCPEGQGWSRLPLEEIMPGE